jgi:methionine-rich copper-binding protein CopC
VAHAASSAARRIAVVLLVVAMLLTARAGEAAAHARLQASAPAGGSTVAVAPATVVLRFSEPIEVDFARSQVIAPDGSRVDNGAPTVTGIEVRQPLLPLRVPGAYTVAFRLVSADGHPVEGTFGFEYAPAAPPATAPASDAQTAPPDLDNTAAEPTTEPPLAAQEPVEPTVASTPALGAVVVALVVLAAGAFVLTRPRRRRPSA